MDRSNSVFKKEIKPEFSVYHFAPKNRIIVGEVNIFAAMKVLEALNIQMVDLKAQYAKLANEIDHEIKEVIHSGAFINGPAVKDFTKNLAQFLKVKHVIPCANGTDALQVALMALNLKPGDEVITTPFTFVATAEVIALLGLKPVFVDIDPKTFNLNISQVEEKIGPNTKCVIPVHLFGQACEMDYLMHLANQHQLYIVEDNAQAIGASYQINEKENKKLGTIGDIGTTSFYPSKNLGAYGDGGALFTNNDALAKTIQSIVNHGQGERYMYDNIGVNSRLDSLQAAILKVKLSYLNNFNEQRQKAAIWYDEHLSTLKEVEIPFRQVKSSHVFHQYTLRIPEKRDSLKACLAELNIPSMIYYPKPLHIQKAYKTYGFKAGDFPEAEKAAAEVLSLPMHPDLTEETVSFITQTILNYFK